MTDGTADRRALATDFLGMAHASYMEAKAKRAYFAHLARKHGVTIQVIADSYKVTPGSIRYLLGNTDPDTGLDLSLERGQGAAGSDDVMEEV